MTEPTDITPAYDPAADDDCDCAMCRALTRRNEGDDGV
jgi:hypothetical protein